MIEKFKIEVKKYTANIYRIRYCSYKLIPLTWYSLDNVVPLFDVYRIQEGFFNYEEAIEIANSIKNMNDVIKYNMKLHDKFIKITEQLKRKNRNNIYVNNKYQL